MTTRSPTQYYPNCLEDGPTSATFILLSDITLKIEHLAAATTPMMHKVYEGLIIKMQGILILHRIAMPDASPATSSWLAADLPKCYATQGWHDTTSPRSTKPEGCNDD